MPVKESLLYVQPIFVQGSAANSIPLLQRVAVFYNNTVGYSPTLAESISKVIGAEQVRPPPTGDQPPTPTPSRNANVQELLRQADAEYKSAQQELANGDLAGYQQHINRMAELIQQALAQGGGDQGDGTPATTTTTPPTTAPRLTWVVTPSGLPSTSAPVAEADPTLPPWRGLDCPPPGRRWWPGSAAG